MLDAYARRDVAKAMEVWRGDEEIDAVNNSLFRFSWINPKFLWPPSHRDILPITFIRSSFALLRKTFIYILLHLLYVF